MRRFLIRFLIVAALLLPFALLYMGATQSNPPDWVDDGFNRTCYEIGGVHTTIKIMPPKGWSALICWVPLQSLEE